MRSKLRITLIPILLIILAVAAGGGQNQPGLVDLAKINPRIVIDLRYATADNFLGEQVYAADTRCLVLEPLAKKLDQAQKLLEQDGLGLKVYDGFRSLAVQKKMWAIKPDGRYVANPYQAGSMHNRGAAADLTLVDSAGRELEMPTAFDAFEERAAQYSKTPTPQQRANRMLLRLTMQKVGLSPITTEWWHYQLPDAKQYPLIP